MKTDVTREEIEQIVLDCVERHSIHGQILKAPALKAQLVEDIWGLVSKKSIFIPEPRQSGCATRPEVFTGQTGIQDP